MIFKALLSAVLFLCFILSTFGQMRRYRDERDVQYTLNQHLRPGERLLWCSGPELGIVFSKKDRFLVPFSMFWLGFSLFWEYLAIYVMDAPLFMPIFGSFFVLIGLYIFIGRFFHDALIRKNTYYGITNQRALILTGIRSKKLISKLLDQIENVTIEENTDRSGTIYLDQQSIAKTKAVNFGSLNTPLSFQRIPEAFTVYNLINEHAKKTHT